MSTHVRDAAVFLLLGLLLIRSQRRIDLMNAVPPPLPGTGAPPVSAGPRETAEPLQ